MTVQIITLKYQDVFKKYAMKYKIFRELYQSDLYGLEIRDINSNDLESIKSITLSNKEICYKYKNHDSFDLLIISSLSKMVELINEIKSNGPENIGQKIQNVFDNYVNYEKNSITIGSRKFDLNKHYILGILNTTPDSFSDGGNYNKIDSAVSHSFDMINSGADIIDVGGESARPGSDIVDAKEEINRVTPIIKKIKELKKDQLISIDTTKSVVAESAILNGAEIINDISGFTFDENMFQIAKDYNVWSILMHIKGNPKTMQNNPYYEEVISEIMDFLSRQIDKALKFGINKIIVDPGIGFGKRIIDNYEIIKRLEEFKSLGFPILIGLSRKSFLGKSLNLDVDERENATSVSETIAMLNGATFIRTHNVNKTKEASKIVNYLNNLSSIGNV
ncbi:MAG: dihydropteroate synthase [Melioribacteraceae bacterium]|nr:dihydropteroate synthase [Melioribacteraceae bacterium]